MSGETWFTSDHHFGHKNIMLYEKEARPFETIEEMHETMIKRWNSVVGKKDTVYHLGDFAFGKDHIKIAERLNGQKKLVLGNHDSYDSREYLRYFEKLYGIKYWEQCILSHMPIHPKHLGQRWFVNVHGHMHSKIVMREVYHVHDDSLSLEFDENYFNVSVERNNLLPFNADIIRERVRRVRRYLKDL